MYVNITASSMKLFFVTNHYDWSIWQIIVHSSTKAIVEEPIYEVN